MKQQIIDRCKINCIYQRRAIRRVLRQSCSGAVSDLERQIPPCHRTWTSLSRNITFVVRYWLSCNHLSTFQNSWYLKFSFALKYRAALSPTPGRDVCPSPEQSTFCEDTHSTQCQKGGGGLLTYSASSSFVPKSPQFLKSLG